MKRLLGPLLLLLGTSAAFAARPTSGSQRFPDDYQPHPCAPAAACASLSKAEIVDAGAVLRGYTIDHEWVGAHWDEMLELMRPSCAKLATCYATPGNGSVFCMDLLLPELWGICDRYPKDSRDFEQCSMFTRVFSLRADLRDKATWKEAQACAAEKTPPAAQGPMKVSIWPETIDDHYQGKLIVYALDPSTRVPLQALVSMEGGQRLSARAPGGKPWTNYEIEWPVKLLRVPDGAGHTRVVPPSITVTREGFAPVTMALPVAPRKVVVEMSPAADKLVPGKNRVTVSARDAATGHPVELRVMLGETTLGPTNEPLELDLPKGKKRPEIWTTSLFDRYDDVVVAPAGK